MSRPFSPMAQIPVSREAGGRAMYPRRPRFAGGGWARDVPAPPRRVAVERRSEKDLSGSSLAQLDQRGQREPHPSGCDCKLLNSLTDFNGIRVLSRLGRPTRSSRAPHRHDSDARAVTRALYRGGRNHVGPANVLSCASRLQDPSPRQARRNRVDFRPKISSKHPLRRRRSPASRCSSVRST